MKPKRIFMSLIGVAITAVSVGAFRFAALGVDPFQTFMCGIEKLVPLHYGTLYILVNLVFLLFALIFDRHYIGIATFFNLFLLGYIVEFSHACLLSAFPDASLAGRGIAFILGFVAVCFGSSLYITADLGVSTYDAIALVCANKWHLGKFKFIRITTDIGCVLLGTGMYLLGGGEPGQIPSIVGIGTVATALCMGPLIDWFNRKISIPLLGKASPV